MLKIFHNLITKAGAAEYRSPSKPIVDHQNSAPVYPPIDQGIPSVAVNNIMASQMELLNRVRMAAGLQDHDFKQLVVPVIRQFASYIHLLPATRDLNHKGAGGLFRLGLEVGFFSLQASDGVIFSGLDSTERRRILEPRWKIASFIAGLCCEMHNPINDMVVVDENGDEWPVYQMPISQWLAEGNRQRYFVQWRANETHPEKLAANTTFVINKIVPPDTIQYLRDGSNKIVSSMLGVITRHLPSEENQTMRNIVYEMRERVIERDADIRPDLYGRMVIGTHMEPYLLDAMRRLVTSGSWEVNQKKSRLWYGTEGLFLVWKTAAKEIVDMLSDDHVPGIPQNHDTLCEILSAADILEMNGDSPYYSIISPLTGAELVAVKFVKPSIILGESADSLERAGSLFKKQRSANAVISVDPEIIETTNIESSAIGSEAPVMNESSGEALAAQSDIYATAEIVQEAEGQLQHVDDVSELEEESLGQNAVDILSRLPIHTADVMKALITDCASGKKGNNMSFETKDGYAVNIDMVGQYGINSTEIIKDLKETGWLWSDPANPKKMVHVVKRGDLSVTMIIFQRTVAHTLGFFGKGVLNARI